VSALDATLPRLREFRCDASSTIDSTSTHRIAFGVDDKRTIVAPTSVDEMQWGACLASM
jgi:hypothetical protein